VVIPKYTAKLTEPRGLASAEKGDSPRRCLFPSPGSIQQVQCHSASLEL
jgi:hypothetical protein